MGNLIGKSFIILVLIGLGVGAAWYANQPSNEPIVASSSAAMDSTQSTTSMPLSNYKDGITVEISDIKTENGKTIASFSMDNHVYNLSDMNVLKYSSFGNIKPSDYEIKETQMGGHHVESEMIFNGDLSGDLIIGLNEDLSFNFKIE